jgi:hypothetical protein
MRSYWRQRSSQGGDLVGRYLGVHWAEELKHQLAGQSEVLRSTGWRQPTFLQGATTQRSNEGPIGFALDVISAWHTDLVLALQLLASIKADEVSIPTAMGLQWVLGTGASTSQPPRTSFERDQAGSRPMADRAGSQPRASYQGLSAASRPVGSRPKPKPTPPKSSARGAAPATNPGSYYGPSGAVTEGENSQPKRAFCEGCGKGSHRAIECLNRDHPNWNQAHEGVRFRDSDIGRAIARLVEGSKWISLPKRDVVWEPNADTWRGGEALQAWEEKLRNANFPPNPAERAFTSNPGTQAVQHGKSLHLGVIRGASEVYPSVEGVLQSEVDPVLQISVECLFGTGCLFSNFIKEDVAEQLGSITRTRDEEHRQVTLWQMDP